MGQTGIILNNILTFVRFGGITIIIIASMALLVTEAIKSKLSPAKIFGVTASAIVAAVLFWILPDLIHYARSDAHMMVPNTVGYQ